MDQESLVGRVVFEWTMLFSLTLFYDGVSDVVWDANVDVVTNLVSIGDKLEIYLGDTMFRKELDDCLPNWSLQRGNKISGAKSKLWKK